MNPNMEKKISEKVSEWPTIYSMANYLTIKFINNVLITEMQ